jgi:hypothetical protein
VVTHYSPNRHDRLARIDTGGWVTPSVVRRINEFAPEGVLAYMAGLDGPEFILLDDAHAGWVNYTLDGPYIVPRQHSRMEVRRA